MIAPLVKIGGVPVTAGYGAIDSVHLAPHTGIDLAVATGTKLYAIGSGVVEKVIDYGSQLTGKTVVVKLASGQKVIYGHLSAAKVAVGQKVAAGQLIALSGNTGHSTGPHLHLAMKDLSNHFIDPTNAASAAVTAPHGMGEWVRSLNPLDGVQEQLGALNDALHNIGYWLNPVNIGREAYNALDTVLQLQATAYGIMGGTIIGIMLIMFGAKWPKKWIFWTWVVYWTLRVLIFI